uniref:Uncharacterized protein n=1 Tax=Cannabis sativa TaxID=3483 RepID=A0A803NV98_CANSA
MSKNSSAAITDIFNLYQKATGQTANLAKSSIMFSPNTPSDSISQFKNSISIFSEGFPSNYLGVPHGKGKLNSEQFHHLVQKVASKLNIWNAKFFFKASTIGISLPLGITSLLNYQVQEILKVPIDPYQENIVKNLLQDYQQAQLLNSLSFGSKVTFTPGVSTPVGSQGSFSRPQSSFKLKVDATFSSKFQKSGLGASVFNDHNQRIVGLSKSIAGASTPIFAEA